MVGWRNGWTDLLILNGQTWMDGRANVWLVSWMDGLMKGCLVGEMDG